MISFISRMMRSLTIVVVTFIASIENLLRITFLSGRGIDEVYREWGSELMNLARANVKVEGLENLTDENGLLLFHHSSLLDIPAVYASFPDRKIRFGAKSELFNIPIFGRSIRAAGTLPIARGEPQAVRKLYEEVARNRPAGVDFALAPEGTRQENNQIGNFKTGPFIFSIIAQMPIFPVLIVRANEVLSKSDWFLQKDNVTIRIRILPPIATEGLSVDARLKLKAQVREIMIKGMEELLNEPNSSLALDQQTVGSPKKLSRPRLRR